MNYKSFLSYSLILPKSTTMIMSLLLGVVSMTQIEAVTCPLNFNIVNTANVVCPPNF